MRLVGRLVIAEPRADVEARSLVLRRIGLVGKIVLPSTEKGSITLRYLRLVAPFWIGVLAILSIGLLTNWIYRYSLLGDPAGDVALTYTSEDPVDVQSVHVFRFDSPKIERARSTLCMGGWPFKYYFSQQTDGAPIRQVWSWRNLLLNVAVCLLLIAAYVCFEYFARARQASRRLDDSVPQDRASNKKRFKIVDLLAFTAVVAALLSYWQVLTFRSTAHDRLYKEIQNAGGVASCSILLPNWLAYRLPIQIAKNFSRLTYVKMDRVDGELLKRALETGTLWNLRLAGQQYDLQLLKKLEDSPLLSELRIAGRKLDSSAIVSIAACKQLQVLNLMRTNVTAKGIQALGEMPGLWQLDVTHSEVQASELTDAPLMQNLKVLLVPHFGNSPNQSIEICNHPKLEVLHVIDYDVGETQNTVKLNVHDLPTLQRLQLDPHQCFHLTLDHLPELEVIREPMLANRNEATVGKAELPGRIWASHISIGEVPQLRTIYIQSRDIEELSLADGANLTVKVLSIAVDSPTPLPVPTLPRSSRLFESLENCVGPRSLSIRDVSIAGKSLAGLAKNSHIQELNLRNTDASSKQLLQLAGMPGLKTLYVPDFSLDGTHVEGLVKTLPSLTNMSTNSVRRLRLVDTPQLERVFLKPDVSDFSEFGVQFRQFHYLDTPGVEALKLVNVPNLAENFEIAKNARLLHIENVPKLTGLVFNGPIPKGSTIVGLQGLRYFAGGGRTINNATFEQVLNCKGLEKITLAYSDVTEDLLKRVNEFPELKYLVLCGPQVSDEVVVRLAECKKLKSLILRNTSITSKGIAAILQLQQLVRLIVDGSEIDEVATAKLALFPELRCLGIPDAKLSDRMINDISTMGNLMELDISNCKVTQSMFNTLSKCEVLTLLKMRNCKVNSPGLRELFHLRAAMIFDLVDSDVAPQLANELLVSSRAIVETNTSAIRTQYQLDQLGGEYSRILGIKEGEVAWEHFAPVDLEK